MRIDLLDYTADDLEHFDEVRKQTTPDIGTINAFDMGVFLNKRYWTCEAPLRDEAEKPIPDEHGGGCGTAACAIGLIMARPWAREAGLSARLTGVSRYSPEFGSALYMDAAVAFFEMTLADHSLVPDNHPYHNRHNDTCLALYLFGPDSYPDPHDPGLVAARIREVIAAYNAREGVRP